MFTSYCTCLYSSLPSVFFFFNVTATTGIYTLSLHDALPILNGCSVTFMAKPDHTWIGSSCHIHASLWRGGKSAFAGESEVFEDRKSTRLNSSHVKISYAVFCLKKKKHILDWLQTRIDTMLTL